MSHVPASTYRGEMLNGRVLGNSLYHPVQTLVIPIAADFDNTEQSTNVFLPDPCLVLDCFLYITTADSSETLDVGTDGAGSNDPDGFLDAASVNGTGWVGGLVASTTGSNNTYLATNGTYGDLFTQLLIAGDDTAASSGEGLLVLRPAGISGVAEVTYTGSASTNTMRGSIVITLVDLSTPISQ